MEASKTTLRKWMDGPLGFGFMYRMQGFSARLFINPSKHNYTIEKYFRNNLYLIEQIQNKNIIGRRCLME